MKGPFLFIRRGLRSLILAFGLLVLLALSACRKGEGGSTPGTVPGRAAIPGGSLYQLTSVWTDENGDSLRLASLQGEVQVLAMMFTHCPSMCPTLVKEIRGLRARLPEKARARTRYVLVSIDPERDTPEALEGYRGDMGLDRDDWTLLRGTPESVRELGAALGFTFNTDSGMDFAHTRMVTVLDPGGEIVHQQAGVEPDPGKLVEAITQAAP